jgi:hypothetical protein
VGRALLYNNDGESNHRRAGQSRPGRAGPGRAVGRPLGAARLVGFGAGNARYSSWHRHSIAEYHYVHPLFPGWQPPSGYEPIIARLYAAILFYLV